MITSEEILELMYGFKFDNLNLSSHGKKQIKRFQKYMYSETMPSTFTKIVFDNLVASNTIKNGTLIYLDFNRIGANNVKYGKKVVTRTMKRSINAIISLLPNGTIPIRMGGDEFVFIVPNEKSNENTVQQTNLLIETISKKGRIKEGISATTVVGYFENENSLYDNYCNLSKECANNKQRDISKIIDVLRAFNLSNSDAIIYCLLSVLKAAKNWDYSDDSIVIDDELSQILENIGRLLGNQEQIDAIRNIIIATKQRVIENQALKKNNTDSINNSNKQIHVPKVENEEDLIEVLKTFTISSWGIPKIAPFLDDFETKVSKDKRQSSKYKVLTTEITHLKASNSKHGMIKTDSHLQKITDLIIETFGEDSYYASLKGGKVLVFTGKDANKINNIYDEIQQKYLPFGLEYKLYPMPKKGWNKANLSEIKEEFENNGNSQAKSLDITDPSIQAIIVDFLAKYIESLLDKDFAEDERKEIIEDDMLLLYSKFLNFELPEGIISR